MTSFPAQLDNHARSRTHHIDRRKPHHGRDAEVIDIRHVSGQSIEHRKFPGETLLLPTDSLSVTPSRIQSPPITLPNRIYQIATSRCANLMPEA